MTARCAALTPTETPAAGIYEAIFTALDAATAVSVGPMNARPLVIPLHDETGAVTGGLWSSTLFGWLQVQMLIVPETARGRGIGTALMLLAELEARRRGCRGALVDTLSFQAVPFYRKLGFTPFGTVDDFPDGHQRIWLSKRFF